MLNFKLIWEFFADNYQWIIGLLIGGGIERILYRPIKFKIDERKIIKILESTTGKGEKFNWRKTRSLASDANLTKERAYEVCAKSEKIKESKGKEEGIWTLRENPNNEETTDWDEVKGF